jgi:hypothetical protein
MKRTTIWFVSEFGRMRHAMIKGTTGGALCGVVYSGKVCSPPDAGNLRRGAITCTKCAGMRVRVEEVEAFGLTARTAGFLPERTWRFVR